MMPCSVIVLVIIGPQLAKKSKAVVDGLPFMSRAQELVDTDRGSGKSMVYLLDIDLKNQTKQGLDIGLEIRKEDLKAQIAFVTAYSEFMPLTFRYKIQALDFVDKSHRKMRDLKEPW